MYLSKQKLAKTLAAVSRLETHLTFRISRLSKLLDIHAGQLASQQQLNLTDYRVLMIIDLFDEISAAELNRLMVIDRAQISRTAADLEKRGLIKTKQDLTSKRRKLLYLSELGKQCMRAIEPVFARRQEQLMGILTEEEFETFTIILSKLNDFVENDLGRPDGFYNDSVKLSKIKAENSAQ